MKQGGIPNLAQKPVCLSARAGSNQRQEADRADSTPHGFFTMYAIVAFLFFSFLFINAQNKGFAVPWGLLFLFPPGYYRGGNVLYARFVDLRCRRIGPGLVDGYCWFFTYGSGDHEQNRHLVWARGSARFEGVGLGS